MNKHELYEIGAVAIGGLALFMFLRHSSQGSGAGVVPPMLASGSMASPTYLTYNMAQPNETAQNSAQTVPSSTMQPAAQAAQPCGCGSGPSSFAGVNSFVDYLNGLNENTVSDYYNAVTSALPSWITEFVNNTFAPDETAASQGQFANLAGR